MRHFETNVGDQDRYYLVSSDGINLRFKAIMSDESLNEHSAIGQDGYLCNAMAGKINMMYRSKGYPLHLRRVLERVLAIEPVMISILVH